MVRWEDLKERATSILKELKGQKMGILGLSIIVVILIIGMLAPVLAPQTNGRHWSDITLWRNNPKRAAPVWYDHLTGEDLAPHKIVTKEPSSETESVGNTQIVTLKYDYKNEYDRPPLDIILFLKGSYEGSKCNVNVYLERPDVEKLEEIRDENPGETLPKEVTLFNGKLGSNGTLDSRLSLVRSPEAKSHIYNFGYQWVTSAFDKDPNKTIPDINMIPEETVFGEANKKMLSDPSVMKGEYTIRVEIVGEQIDIEYGEDATKIIYAGQVYGLMGTDQYGRDIAKGWVWGARYALILSLIVAVTTVVIGTFYGMTSAYFGGWVDEIMQRLNEVVIGIPILPILIILMYVVNRSIWIMIFLMSILYWRGIAKTIRARGLQIRQSTYIEASESLGSSGGRVITAHMIPQILPYSLAEAALLVPIVIITEASLSVLGLGDPTIVTWGKILSQANTAGATVQGMWWWVILPGLGITLVGFAFIASGMAIERVVNPKMRQR